MDNNHVVSVIIPCYNQGQYLYETLNSVQISTYPYIEVIIVDDGSTSTESNEILNSLMDETVKGNQVKFIFQNNQGPAAARNNGVKHSKGDYILFLDSDDKIDSTYIEKCVWFLTKYPNISFVYPSVRHFGALDDLYHPRSFNIQHLLEDNYIVVSSLIRRKVFLDNNGFDIGLSGYEDWDFWIRASAAGHVGFWLQEPLFFYRRVEVSRLTTDNSRRKELLKEIHRKNKLIFESYMQNKGNNTGFLKKYIAQKRPRLAYYKWRLFVIYVRIANKIPSSLKEKLKRYIKPVIQAIFKYEETGHTGINQVQTLEKTEIDEKLENSYEYKMNSNFINLFESKDEEYKNHRILFIVPWLVVGGADKVNLDLIKNFTNNGYSVHVFSTLPNEHPWHYRFKEFTENVTHLGNVFSNLYELLDYVNDYIAAKKINIVQMSNSQLGYQISEVIKTYNPHVGIVDLNHMEEPYAPFDYFRYSVKYKQWFDHRVVITPYLKEAMIRKYGEVSERITVVPNGVEVPPTYEETSYLSKESKLLQVGFVGRMEEQKQPLDFIKIAKIILNSNPNVRFTVIGSGSLLPRAKSLAKYLKISDSIDFLGSRDDAPEIMKNKIHIFLAPSLREGLPIVGLEALSLGIPIVATDVPGWSDLVFDGKTGFLAPVNDCEKMAEHCLNLINNQSLRETISRECYQLSNNKYSLEKTSKQYLEIYDQII